MSLKYIEYAGAGLEIPSFLVPLWPYNMPLHSWPSYCGVGNGLGDWIVPEKMRGAIVSPACFVHDIMWAIADGSWWQFQFTNNIFRRNCEALVFAQLQGWDCLMANIRCELYWIAVSSPIGWSNHNPAGPDPYKNPVVREKLNRLARRHLGIP